MTKNNESAQGTISSPQLLKGILKTLVVGDISRWTKMGHRLPEVEGLMFINLEDLTINLLSDFQPDLILSPLMQYDYDATEVAQKLSRLGFQGRYRAVADGLPNSDVVTREVRSIAPDIDFELIALPAGPITAPSQP